MDSRFCQYTWSAAIVSTLTRLTPLAHKCFWNVDHHVFFGRSHFLFLSAGIQSIAWLAGRYGAIWITCLTNQSLLSSTMSCKCFCPVRANTSVLVTLSFHVTPISFVDLLTEHIPFLLYPECAFPSFTGINGCRHDHGCV